MSIACNLMIETDQRKSGQIVLFYGIFSFYLRLICPLRVTSTLFLRLITSAILSVEQIHFENAVKWRRAEVPFAVNAEYSIALFDDDLQQYNSLNGNLISLIVYARVFCGYMNQTEPKKYKLQSFSFKYGVRKGTHTGSD